MGIVLRLNELDVDNCLGDAVLYQGGFGFRLSRECEGMSGIDK